MDNIIIYTKKFPLNFDENSVALVDVSSLLEELSREYIILDRNPTITIQNDVQYVTVKLGRKEEKKKIGF